MNSKMIQRGLLALLSVSGLFLLYFQFINQRITTEMLTTPSHYLPDNDVLATQFGQKIIDVRDISRRSADSAEKALAELNHSRVFGNDPTLHAYKLMIQSNIASNRQERDKVQEIAEQLSTLARKHQLEWLLAESQAEMAIETYLKGDLRQAKLYIDSAIAYADSIDYDHAQIKNYNTAGVIASTQGELLLAQEYFHYGLELARKLPEHDYHPKLLSNMALIYIFLEDWSKALSFLEQGKSFYQGSDEYSSTAEIILHANESFIQYNLGDAVAARQAYMRALDVFVPLSHSRRTELVVLRTEADVLYLEQDYLAAKNVANHCISLADPNALPLEAGLCYFSRAKADIELDARENVTEDLLEAFRLVKQANAYSWEVLIHKKLSKAYEMLGDYRQALTHHRIYYKQNKALLFDRRQSELFLLQESFETDSLQQQAALADSEAAVAKLKVDKQRLRNWTVIAFTFIVLMSFIQIRKRAENTQQENRQLQKLHQQDPLTGLGNRRYIGKWLQENYLTEKNYCVALVDIDDFKKINDTYGHDIGDQVIVETANRLRKAIGKEDAAVRWGGEEFLLILKQGSKVELRLEQIVRSISCRKYQTHDGLLSVTVSVGASRQCHCLTDEKNFETSIKQADKALYSAKSEGKNHVQSYDAQRHDPDLSHQ